MKNGILIVLLVGVAATACWLGYDRFAFRHRVAVLEEALATHKREFPEVSVAFSSSHRVDSVGYFGKVRNEEEKRRLVVELSQRLSEDAVLLCRNVRAHEEMPEPNKRPEPNAGATPVSPSTPAAGVAHP